MKSTRTVDRLSKPGRTTSEEGSIALTLKFTDQMFGATTAEGRVTITRDTSNTQTSLQNIVSETD